jgi:hypothetical protein
MAKVGILTFHSSMNYGATLQTFALYQFVKSLGHQVEVIDYQPPKVRDSDIKSLYFRGQKLFNPLLAISGTQKLLKMKRFVKNHLQLSHKTYYTRSQLNQANHDYDIVICGSDEIWNIHSALVEFGKDLSYFLDFIAESNICRVSYAASFGYTTELGQSHEAIAKLLQGFSAISVRDHNSVNLVKACNCEVQKVLDPTFLGNFSQISQAPKHQRDYILVYGFNLSQQQGNWIKAIARNEGLDVISIGVRPGDWRPPINHMGIGPEEWLGYFSQASYVFTNFFHGVVFSIIYRKPFTNFINPGKSIKVKDLLGGLDLCDRIVTESEISDLPPKLNWEMNLNQERLNALLEQSKEYLRQSL